MEAHTSWLVLIEMNMSNSSALNGTRGKSSLFALYETAGNRAEVPRKIPILRWSVRSWTVRVEWRPIGARRESDLEFLSPSRNHSRARPDYGSLE